MRRGQMELVLSEPLSPALDRDVMSRAVAAICDKENETQDGQRGGTEREKEHGSWGHR